MTKFHGGKARVSGLTFDSGEAIVCEVREQAQIERGKRQLRQS